MAVNKENSIRAEFAYSLPNQPVLNDSNKGRASLSVAVAVAIVLVVVAVVTVTCQLVTGYGCKQSLSSMTNNKLKLLFLPPSEP